jgi:pimeloyl-ACP methyl ester carboxylesterase
MRLEETDVHETDWNPAWEWMVEERTRIAQAPDVAQFANAVVKSVGAMLDGPTSGGLEELQQPALIVHGERDGLIPNPYLHPGRASHVFATGAKRLPHATLVEIPDAGHMVQVERPAQVDTAILTFLRETR